jgi:hypothetical protein
MNLPQFNAEASLGPTLGIYRGKAVYGRSGAVEVLPMLPRRPTIDDEENCRIGCGGNGCGEHGCEGLLCWCCYDDGCWICNRAGQRDCAWDPAYRAQPGRPPRPLPVLETGGGVFHTGGVFTTA